MSSKQTIYIIKNGAHKSVSIPIISDSENPDDPSIWLKRRENIVINYKVPEEELDEKTLRTIISNGIQDKLNLDTVIYYLVKYFLMEYKFIPSTKWIINSDTVFEPDQEYTIGDAIKFNILNEKLSTGDWVKTGDPQYTQQGLIGILLSVYRYNNVGRGVLGTYQDNLKNSMSQLLATEPFSVEEFPDNILANASWLTNKYYKVICAMSDMFFNKFPMEEISKLKITTVSARYKDCAIISDINHAKKIFSFEDSQFYRILLEPSITREMISYLEKLEKLPIEYAICPYIKELGGMNKSPFSALMSPNTHNFIHIVGVLHGYQRSFNSRIFEDSNLPSVTRYATIISYLLRDNVELSAVFAATEEEGRMLAERKGKGANTDTLTPNNIAMTLNRYIEDSNFRDIIDKWARQRASKISDPRLGSVGKYIDTIYGIRE
ncbi:N protein [Puerto Almendras virus]|uniref:Nucleoprotein n=1 Tax=Puerto Almendras virus TaxID=1479613 RepID=X4R286_9RHAB|nr:N protein [Puerto Almendras virus]AHU86502.1 N protein [Puerto Almendras virus]